MSLKQQIGLDVRIIESKNNIGKILFKI